MRWRDRSSEWQSFFAWQPYCIDGLWIWLERIEKRRSLSGIVDVWEYRLPASCDSRQMAETVKHGSVRSTTGAVPSEARADAQTQPGTPYDE
jgi:hypothetical protein